MTSGSGTNFIATDIGMKRSGKSHHLAQLAVHFPRRIVFDFVGEFYHKIPGAVDVDTLAGAAVVLKQVQPRDKWVVVCQLIPSEAIDLIEAVCDQKKSYARAVGGLAFECGEVDQIAPNNAAIHPAVHSIFARGRHIGPVSALMAARRPQEINKIVTSQSDVICAFRMHEPRDADYLANTMGSDAVQHLLKLQRHEYLRYFTNYGVLQHVSATGVVRDLRAARPVPEVPEASGDVSK